MERTYFDHLKLGRQLKHYVYPHVQLPNVTGFEDGLRENIPGKLSELLTRCRELKRLKEKSFKLITQKTKPGSFGEFFCATLVTLDFAEYFVIQKWLNYWLSLWYKVSDKPLPQKLHKPLGWVDPGDIERAKQSGLANLYDGKLRKSGSRLVGLCPFHEEKTPSFFIFSDNHFHCYGCGAHGDPIAFIQRTRNLSFPEAVRCLL